jgi:nucleoside-diphosphate-sugar epimerase
MVSSGAWSPVVVDSRRAIWWSSLSALTITLALYLEDELLGEAIQTGRAIYASANLRNNDQIIKVCERAKVVFHMAAPDSSINNYQLHYSVNVKGTKNVTEACVHCKVKRLNIPVSQVYCSMVFMEFIMLMSQDLTHISSMTPIQRLRLKERN